MSALENVASSVESDGLAVLRDIVSFGGGCPGPRPFAAQPAPVLSEVCILRVVSKGEDELPWRSE